MPKRLSLLLQFFIVALICTPSFAIVPSIVRNPHTERLNQLVQELGSGQNALLAVRLKSKVAVAGYVKSSNEDSVVLVNAKNGDESTVYFNDVDRLQGYNLTSGKEVHAGTGIRAKIARLAIAGWPTHQMPQNKFFGGTALIVGIIIGILLAIVLSRVF